MAAGTRGPVRVGDREGVQTLRLASGVRLCYVTRGAPGATPVLLLHAWGESRRSFDRLLPLLPADLQVTALDQRGHGDSERPAHGYSLDDAAADVVGLMDAVGVPSAVLLGSSSGGYVAQQVAVAHPHRVRGLVLVGAPRSLLGRPPFADEVERLTDPVDEAWVRRSLTWFPLFHHVPEWYVDERVADGVRIPAHVWQATLEGLCRARPPTEAGTITAPTLVLWGDRDELLAHDQQEMLVSAVPSARLLVYEGTGHLVLWERPDRVAADVSSFVTGLPGS